MTSGEEEIPESEDLILDEINDVIVHHHHGDHSAGLEDMGYYKMFFVQPDKRIMAGRNEHGPVFNQEAIPNLYGTKAVLDILYKKIEITMCNDCVPSPDRYFNFTPIEPGEVLNIGGGVELEVFETDHGVPGFASLLRYNGKSVAYSSDTRFNMGLADFMSRADVMIHECDGSNAVHTTPDDLRKWLDFSRYAGRLYVCHMDDAVHPEDDGLTPVEEFDFIDV
jgi:ribonuclease BN (tRNA processing enzyme)